MDVKEFLDRLINRRRNAGNTAHITKTDKAGNVLEEYDEVLKPSSKEEMFGEPQHKLAAHVVRRDKDGNILEEYDTALQPSSEEEMFGAPQMKLMKTSLKRNQGRELSTGFAAGLPQEKPLKAETQGIKTEPISTEQFLDRLKK